MNAKRLLSCLLVLCLMLIILPAAALADDEEPTFTSMEPAAAYLREKTIGRISPVEFGYITSMSTDLNDLVNGIWDLACIHSGAGTEGDYLRWQTGRVTKGYSGSSSNGMYDLSLAYQIEYYTTPAQEAELTEQLSSVTTELALDGKSDYQKFDAIYDYIVKHVTYDYEHLNDESYTLKRSAYAALVNGTAVCQGYANLLYRMLLDAGIDCRIITGKGEGTNAQGETTLGDHAWNIVKLGGLYYNVDATWDSSGVDVYYNGVYQGKEYPMTYRLRGTDNFPKHIRDDEFTTEAFEAAYPMSASDYEPSEPASAQVMSASLTLAGDIGVNYYVAPDDALLADNGAYAQFTVKGVPGDPILLNTITPDASGRYVFTQSVAAKEMTEQITLRLYTSDHAEVALFNAAGTPIDAAVYSVAKYVSCVSDDTKPLADSLASYGAYAMEYFGYEPVDEDTDYASAITGANVYSVTPETLESFLTTYSGAVTGAAVSGISLSLESLTTLNISFTGLEDCTVTVNDTAVTPEVSGERYVVRILNIAAKDLDRPHTVVISCGGETMTLTASVLSYARNALNAYSSSPEKTALCSLVKALYLYSVEANAYFE